LKVYGTEDLLTIEEKLYTEDKHAKVMEKYGVLLNDIDLQRIGKTQALATVFIRIFHKLVLALGIIIFLDYPFFTIASFNFNALFFIIYIETAAPFKEKGFHRQVILDEYLNLIVIYHLFCFTKWSDLKTKHIMGNSIIYIMFAQSAAFALYFWYILLLATIQVIKRKMHMNKVNAVHKVNKAIEQDRKNKLLYEGPQSAVKAKSPK